MVELKPNQRIINFETEVQAIIVEQSLNAAGFTLHSYIMESIDEDFGDPPEEF